MRIITLALIVLGGVTWAYGCSDGATEPPPPEPPLPAAVTVNPATAELVALGATVQLSTQVRDQNGQAMAGATVTWSSGAAGMATVNASGLVTAAGNGTATITATAEGVSGTATVTVAQEVSAVTVSPAADTVVAGDNVRLTAEATDANGHALADADFSWASSDPSVAAVDATGLVTGVGAGEAEVTATSSGVSGGAALVVTARAPETVAVTPETVALAALGDTVRLAAEVRDQLGDLLEAELVTWASADTLVATVNASGLVTAAGNGTATITATAGGVSGSATVTVAQEVSAVTVSPVADTVAAGDTLRLTAEATDANGHAVADAQFSWTSSDTSVAGVDANGLVTGIAAGEATITTTAGSAVGTAHITVTNRDRAALVTLYEAANGPGWIENRGWLSDRPLGDWHGVTTGPDGRVTALRLPASNLAGSIPPDLSNLSSLEILDFERNELAGPIPPELGMLSSLTTLILGVNDLTGQIPSELGDLSNLEVLRLRRNDLSGPVPPELASLRNLTRLGLERNNLEGQIPAGFVGLERLRSFHFADNEGLCVSGSADFTAWLAQLEVHVGQLCNEGDRAVLASLYAAAGGMNWTRSDGWLGDAALEDWHGVGADSAGRVTGLDLSGNELAGRLPVLIGELTSLISLRIDDNAALTGGLPLSLSELSIEELNYTDTGLCIPSHASFSEWLASIPSHEGTDAECTPLSEREVLVLLYEATGGPGWTDDENWLSERPLDEWRGVTTGGEGQVVSIDLFGNNLTGAIPSELGTLAGLETLNLARNSLTGPIPSGLGNLAGLEILSLGLNDLTGPIPPELGSLSSLRELSLQFNGLTGPIPPELGTLSGLERLILGRNALTGAIPSELGSLSGLEALGLDGNDLAGPIPPELGSLSRLRTLSLHSNDLTGPIPPELGNLSGLETLFLYWNDLTGPIPPELGSLASLTTLYLISNGLTGPIPPELGNLSSLRTLYLISNGLTGSIPPEPLHTMLNDDVTTGYTDIWRSCTT